MEKLPSSLYAGINFRRHPERYHIGRGEQGVLTAEPYKSEILPHWRFKTPELAWVSAQKIYQLYLQYQQEGDFVGMDMARKFLQMGYTRSMRYARHKSGQKYDGPVPQEHKGQSGAWGRKELPLDPDTVKAESAAIFKQYYKQVMSDPDYQQRRQQHLKLYS